MGRYIARRILIFIPTLLIVGAVVFLMVDLVPGDPVVLLLGVEAEGDAVAAMREKLGFNRPLHERMANWFANALQGDLGDSLFLRESIMESLSDRYPVTLRMAILALLVAIGVGIPAGIVAAVYQGGLADWGAMVLALIVLSLPSFWLGLNMIYLFGVELRWLPVGGYVPLSDGVGEYLRHLLMPSVSLGLAYAAMIARMTRTSMLEVLRMDYVRTAEAKGLHRWIVILRHAFRNALIPVITVVGLAFGGLLGGSAVTETVYNLPGVGRLIVEAVQRRDYPVIQGGILALTVTYLAVNLLADLFYAWVDPQIRYE
jgi:peptide/nickel transport system permease protein